MTAAEEIKTFATVDSSRIRVLNAPVLAPGVCCICGCGHSEDRQYIDLGIDVDYTGVMYFCTFCMTELVNVLGCATPEQYKQLQDELDSARQTILEFQQQKAAIDGVVDTLRSTGLFSSADIIDSPSSDYAEPEHVTDFVKAERQTSGSSKNSKQSDPKQGSDDIPKFGSNDLESFL